jgi:predicted DNA-binding transcriptional regulator AlpA
LSKDAAAYRAGFCRRTLERMIAEGTGPATVQMSRRRVGILESDLEAWLLKRRRPAPGEETPQSSPRKSGAAELAAT